LYHAPSFLQAVLLAAGAIACLLAAAIAAGAAGASPIGIVGVGELGLAVVPIAYAIRRRDTKILGLRRPPARHVAAAILVGGSLWYLNLLVIDPLVAPDPALDRLVTEAPLALVLACAALAPPIGEELVFRGILARSFANRLRWPVAVVVSAAAFSAYHLNVAQAIPTFTLGLALGYIALRADSIVPTIIGHALNNGIAILLQRLAPSAELPVVAGAAIALALTASGIVLAARGAA
jgi:membrane protease YdiL (CAAX protease family)